MFHLYEKIQLLWNTLPEEYRSSQSKYIDKIVEYMTERPDLRKAIEEMINCIVRNKDGSSISYNSLIEEIINSQTDDALLVQGTQGTGKSTFLSVVWFDLLCAYCNKESGTFPCYVDLHCYASLVESEAITQLTNDLAYIQRTIEHLKPERVFFILDGIDTYKRELSSLQKRLYDHIHEYRFKTVCLGSAESIPENQDQKEKSSWLKIEYSKSLIVSAIPGTDRTRIENLATSIVQVFANTQNISVGEIAATSIRYSVRSVDFRTLLLITRIADKGINVTQKNFGAALIEFYQQELEKGGLKIEAQHAAEYQLGIKPEEDSISQQPRILRHKNRLIRDFLTAYDFFLTIQEKKRNDNTRLSDYCKLNLSFSVSTNRFLKDFYSYSLSKRASNSYTRSLVSLFESADTSIAMQAQFAYMLGRVNKEEDCSIARKALRKKWESLHKSVFSSRTHLIDYKKSITAAKLVLIRTVAVSLIMVGYNEHFKDYLKYLLYNDRMLEINRAFHLEYYSDEEKRQNASEYIDNISTSFELTRKKLSKNIEKSIQTAEIDDLVNLDVITLFSFSISRANNLTLTEKKELIALGKSILNAKRRRGTDLYNSSLVRAYVQLACEIMSDRTSFLFDTIIELYRMKNIKREKWLRLNVTEAESVADHTLFCVYMAILLLPPYIDPREERSDTLDYSQYSKDKVISMLLVHSLGVNVIGDVDEAKKSGILRMQESKRVRYYGMLTSIPYLYGFGSYSDIYEEYESLGSVNARIARDIDAIEEYIQACLYSVRANQVELEEWIKQADAQVFTHIGKEIREIIDREIASKIKGGKSREMGETFALDTEKLSPAERVDNENEMIWIHLSDLHYDPRNDVTNTKVLLNNLREKLPQLVREAFGDRAIVDLMLCTGDYRFAKVQTEATAREDAKAVASYILDLGKAVGIDSNDIFVIPGNHDLNRNHRHIRDILITELHREYESKISLSGKLDHPDQLRELMDGFSYFHFLLQELYGELKGDTIWNQWCLECCRIEKRRGLQFLLLNTALFSGKAKPKNELGYGSGYPYELIGKFSKENPTIILAHHGHESLSAQEQKQMETLVKKLPRCNLYLCGHTHYDMMSHVTDQVTQLTAGTLRQNDQVDEAGFYIGKYLTREKAYIIKSIKWNKWPKEWYVDKNFNSDGYIRINTL